MTALRAVALVCTAGLALSTTACMVTSSGAGPMHVLDARVDKDHPPTYLGLPLKSGQIFLTEAPGAYSFVFVLIPAKFFPFTHSSIISVENGEAYVYDISGEYQLGFHDRVMDNVDGGMRKTPFVQYAQNNLYGEVFDPPEGVRGDLVVAFAKQQFESGVKFDAFFRYDEHEKLFCTELTQLALEAGGAKPRVLEPVRDNPSLHVGMSWLGVPPDRALPAGVFGDTSRYRGAVGQFASRTAAYAYFEAKRELHRRFKPDQRLGYLFILKSSGDIEARPQVDDFAWRAAKAFDGDADPPPPGDPRIAQRVRTIADEMFGPVPD